MQGNVGFGDVVMPRPEQMTYPTLLDMPASLLRAYQPETIIAENICIQVAIAKYSSFTTGRAVNEL
ncbi:MAG: hypothetical protein V4568_15700 [Pseudomonadota bacterium]